MAFISKAHKRGKVRKTPPHHDHPQPAHIPLIAAAYKGVHADRGIRHSVVATALSYHLAHGNPAFLWVKKTNKKTKKSEVSKKTRICHFLKKII